MFSCLQVISIHALREEGDAKRATTCIPWQNFYPRPPRGGRRQQDEDKQVGYLFLSTPSARRATARFGKAGEDKKFLSTPSARRATVGVCNGVVRSAISIHALREEGDLSDPPKAYDQHLFLSTPSARRATGRSAEWPQRSAISIHALREEGDASRTRINRLAIYFYPRPPRGGRRPVSVRRGRTRNFYPRPPRGGRRLTASVLYRVSPFLSTPSARRATPAFAAG